MLADVSGSADLLAGQFGRATRLSPKALRLYATQGLLVPARVDPATGYRYYRPEQIGRALLIARLRRLDLPLARIATLLDLAPEPRDAELRAWLAAQRLELQRRQELVDALDRRSEQHTRLIAQVMTRTIPERKLLTVERRLHVDELVTFVDAAADRLRAHLLASGVPSDGQLRVFFHGMVTLDSDGPIEVSVCCTGPVEPVGDFRIRLAPAQTEAFLPVERSEAWYPRILGVYEALESWMEQHHALSPVASPSEVHPGSGSSFMDVAYPISTGCE